MVIAYKASGLKRVDKRVLLRELPVKGNGVRIVVPPTVKPDCTDIAVVGEELLELIVHKFVIMWPIALGTFEAFPTPRETT